MQVHNLPIRFQTKRIAEQLCEAIGKVNIGIDEAEIEGDNLMRVQVTIDISQPLSRGRVVSLDSGKELWVHFKYERLPSLCFWCGCLTHDDHDCDLWVESEGSLLPESQQFDPWLKAASFVPTRKYVVRVLGFFASKKSDVATEKPKTTKKTPAVVVRTGKPVSEVIRLEKESLEVHNEENIEPVFREMYQ